MKEAIKRVIQAGGFGNRKELAKFLELDPGELQECEKGGEMPKGWLYHLRHRHGVNPAWVLTGNGEPLALEGAYDRRGRISRAYAPLDDCPAVTQLRQALHAAEACAHVCAVCRGRQMWH